MKIAVAADHAGFALKQVVVQDLTATGNVLCLGARIIGASATPS